MRPDSPFYLRSFEVLKKSALFSRLDEDVLKEMFLIFRHQEWEKKQVVMEPAQTVEQGLFRDQRPACPDKKNRRTPAF